MYVLVNWAFISTQGTVENNVIHGSFHQIDNVLIRMKWNANKVNCWLFLNVFNC